MLQRLQVRKWLQLVLATHIIFKGLNCVSMQREKNFMMVEVHFKLRLAVNKNSTNSTLSLETYDFVVKNRNKSNAWKIPKKVSQKFLFLIFKLRGNLNNARQQLTVQIQICKFLFRYKKMSRLATCSNTKACAAALVTAKRTLGNYLAELFFRTSFQQSPAAYDITDNYWAELRNSYIQYC